MTRATLIQQITEFLEAVRSFRQLLLKSRDDIMPELVRNHEEIAARRSELVRTRARLQKYLVQFGKNPRMRDGVNPEYYCVYDNAFSSDILIRVGDSIDAVIQDLDHVLGILEGMSDREFDEAMTSNDSPHIIAAGGGGGGGGGGPGGGRGGDGGSVVIGIPSEKITINNIPHVHRQYFWLLLGKLGSFLKNPLVELAVFLLGAYLVYRFGWNH